MKMSLTQGAFRRLALAAALVFAIAFALLNLPLASHGAVAAPGVTPQAKYPITHIIIIDKENHSFDNMFGLFPGADGSDHAMLSTGRIVPLGRTPDRLLLDV